MATNPAPRNTRHRPPVEDRKDPGGNYGGPRRAPIKSEDTVNPVAQVFSEAFRPAGGWTARTDARSKAERDGGLGGK